MDNIGREITYQLPQSPESSDIMIRNLPLQMGKIMDIGLITEFLGQPVSAPMNDSDFMSLFNEICNEFGDMALGTSWLSSGDDFYDMHRRPPALSVTIAILTNAS
jgi:hypothetical protein